MHGYRVNNDDQRWKSIFRVMWRRVRVYASGSPAYRLCGRLDTRDGTRGPPEDLAGQAVRDPRAVSSMPRSDHSFRCQPRSQGRDIKCLTPSNRLSAQHGRDPGAGKTADSRGDTSWYLKGPRSLFPPVDFLVQGYRIVNKRARTGPAAAAAAIERAAAPPRGKRQRRGRQQRTHAPSGPSSSS